MCSTSTRIFLSLKWIFNVKRVLMIIFNVKTVLIITVYGYLIDKTLPKGYITSKRLTSNGADNNDVLCEKQKPFSFPAWQLRWHVFICFVLKQSLIFVVKKPITYRDWKDAYSSKASNFIKVGEGDKNCAVHAVCSVSHTKNSTIMHLTHLHLAISSILHQDHDTNSSMSKVTNTL